MNKMIFSQLSSSLKLFKIIAIGISFFVVSGCKPHEGLSKLNYSLLDQASEYSLLRDMNDDCVINLSFTFGQYSKELTTLQKEEFKTMSKDTLLQWNNAMKEVAGDWRCSDIHFNEVSVDEVSCQNGQIDERLGYTPSCENPGSNSVVKFVTDDRITRSHAFMENMLIAMQDIRSMDKNSYELTILHEWGHLIGLADCYTEHPNRDWPNAEVAAMNSQFVSEGITDDDKAGLLELWNEINGNDDQQSCVNDFSIGVSNTRFGSYCTRNTLYELVTVEDALEGYVDFFRYFSSGNTSDVPVDIRYLQDLDWRINTKKTISYPSFMIYIDGKCVSHASGVISLSDNCSIDIESKTWATLWSRDDANGFYLGTPQGKCIKASNKNGTRFLSLVNCESTDIQPSASLWHALTWRPQQSAGKENNTNTNSLNSTKDNRKPVSKYNELK